jgi:RNA polymerase sigma-70 factor (ECF subfamily)
MRAGDSEAWQRSVDLYAPLIYHWCCISGLRDDDAGDVVQEVFQSVVTSLDDFRSDRGGGFRAWLRGITRHRILDHFRTQKGLPAAQGGTDAQQQFLQVPDIDEPSTATSVFAPEDEVWRRALDLVRAEFENNTWRAFWRVAVDHERPADVATELGMSVHAVYKAKSRILRRVRQELADLEEDA